MEIRHLAPADLDLIGAIDRSEEVHLGYVVEGGELSSSEVNWVVPRWSRRGPDPHSVEAKIEFCRPILDRGGTLLGAFEEGAMNGLAVIEPLFEQGVAWLAFLHVGRPYRRMGVASALWTEVEGIALAADAHTIYVSATPSESAVGFYLSRHCVLAAEPHPELHALEPDDIHLIRSLGAARGGAENTTRTYLS